MAHTTAAQVAYFINTSVASGTITSMIALSDAELDGMLGGASMSTNLKALCSARLCAIMLAQRDPQARTVGGAEVDFGARIRDWRDFVDRQVAIATKDFKVQ